MKKWIFFLLGTAFIACSKDDAELKITSTQFTIEGVGDTFDNALITLSNADTVLRLPYEVDLQNGNIKYEIGSELNGKFEVALYLFYGDDLLEDASETSRSIFKGKEALLEVEFDGIANHTTLSGPFNSNEEVDLELFWSDRLFHSLEVVKRPSLTLSYPEDPCEFDIHLILDTVEIKPEYSYIDYFVYDENENLQKIGLSECFDCDLYEHINSFKDQVIAESQKSYCENTNWVLAETLLMIIYGSEEGDLEFFFQRWDEKRDLVIPIGQQERARVIKSRKEKLNQQRNNR